MSLALSLNRRLTKETLPDGDNFLTFVKMPSQILSEFWGTEMYLRSGVILPNSYYDNPPKTYPVTFNHWWPSQDMTELKVCMRTRYLNNFGKHLTHHK